MVEGLSEEQHRPETVEGAREGGRCWVIVSSKNDPTIDGDSCGWPSHERDADGRCGIHGEFEKTPPESFQWILDRIKAGHNSETVVDLTRAIFPDGFKVPENYEFRNKMNFRKTHFLGKSSFDIVTFAGSTSFLEASFAKEASFNETIFLEDSSFNGASFDGDARFSEAIFHAQISFNEASFSGEVWFYEALFMKKAEFNWAIFLDDAIFSSSYFATGVVFNETSFAAEASFIGAYFFGDATFHEAIFDAQSYFKWASVGGSLHLWAAKFKGISDWNGVRLTPGARVFWDEVEINSDLRLDNLEFQNPVQALAEDLESWNVAKNKVDMARKKSLPKPNLADPCYQLQSPDIRIDFRNVPIRSTTNIRFQGSDTDDPQHRLDCSKILFTHTDVSRIRFRNCKWDNDPAWRSKLGRFLHPHRTLARVADEDYLSHMPRGHESKVRAEDRIAPSLVADVYKGLRVSYEGNLRQADAGRFHIREMEMRRLALGSPPKRALENGARTRWGRGRDQFWSSLDGVRRWGERVGLWWYRWTSRYGESFVLPAALLMGWVFLFGWLLSTDLPNLPMPFASWYDGFSAGLQIAPKSVAGRTGLEFLGRLGAIYFVTVAVVALRRHFRRHRGGI